MVKTIGSSFGGWLKGLVIVGCIGVVVAAAWFIHIQRFLAGAVSTQGSISQIVEEYDSEGHLTYTPEIRYKDQQGQNHFIRTFISSNEGDYQVGEPMPVLYNPQNPTQASIGTFWEIYLGCILVAILSLAALISGGVTSILLKQEEQRKQNLLSNGQRIEATVTKVTHVTAIVKHGQSPWLVNAEWTNPATNQKYDFSSDLLASQPSGLTEGGKVIVCIEPNNPEHYVMDVGLRPEA